jgi:hypothetical protein
MNGWLEHDNYKVRKIGWFFGLFKLQGITLAPLGIWLDEKEMDDPETIQHEEIHWKQQIGLYIVSLIVSTLIQLFFLFKGIFAWWFIPFQLCPFLFYYILYGVEWIIKIFIYGKAAYRNISFERAAYAGDDGKYTWLKYL